MNNHYGLTLETIGKIQGVFDTLPYIEEAILYGSRAMGNYKNGSDIDLTLKQVNQDSITLILLL